MGSHPAGSWTIALATLLLLSGLALLGSVEPGAEVGAIEPAASAEEEVALLESVEPSLVRSTPMTRDEIRAWVGSLGMPEMRLAYGEGEFDRSPVAARDRDGISPNDADETAIHKADQVHALGFDGTGIRVAVIDTGMDFVHPDLFNVTARVMNASSPYFLHPIAFTAASLNDYLVAGFTSPNLPFGGNERFGSWYVNTSYATTVVELADGTQVVNWTDGVTALSWEVTGEAGLNTGDEVRIGFHPDDKFLLLSSARMRPGVVLFNSTGPGAPFDQVMVDLDTDLSFVGEKHAWINTDWATFDPRAELISKDLDVPADGIPDVSGGMLYFIADGVREIPYASRQIEVLNKTFQTQLNDDTHDLWASMGIDPTANVRPGAGDLVLLLGDFDFDPEDPARGSHGTWTSSTIAGQSVTGGGSTGPILKGMAPGVKIIGSGNNFDFTDPFQQMGLFTALVFAAEGYDGLPGTGDEAHIASNSWGGFDWSGWDWSSRYADWVSAIHAADRTLFVFSAGNAGAGYGGRSSPAGGASLLVTGAMENRIHRTDPWFQTEGGPNPSFGETADFSTRGPSTLGRHRTDVVASGDSAYGADALNNNPFTGDSGTVQDGSSSWVLWSGSSLAAPNVAGMAALVYQAYMASHAGAAPAASIAKTIIKNSADDARQDPFTTGPGIANALRAVRIANEMDGLTTSLHEWYPGAYRGAVHPGYTQILFPGDVDAVVVDARNHRPSSSMAVTIEDAVLDQVGSLNRSFTRIPTTPPNEFLLTDAGLLRTDGSVLVAAPPGLFSSADLIRVTAFIDRVRMSDPLFYRLRLLAWTDVDTDGSFDGFLEENLMVEDWISLPNPEMEHGPNGFASIYDPVNRTQDGLVLRIQPEFESFLSAPVIITVEVDYFQRVDFSWLAVGPPSLVIAPASAAPVTLTVTVPGDADPGLYEAVVLFRLDDGNVTTLPVVVNVAASTLPLTFGGNAHDSGPYQQGEQYGKRREDIRSSGDKRYYFLDLPTATTVTFLLGWDDPASDHAMFILSNTTDWFSANEPARYGPGTADLVASVEEGSNATSVVAPLNAGLSIIVVRSSFLAGLAAAEHPTGLAGVMTATPSPWTGVGIPVDGSETFTIVSEIGFPDVVASVETGSLTLFTDEPVAVYPCNGCQGGDAPFLRYLYNAPTRLETQIAAGTVRADFSLFFFNGARDVDMGVFYDDNCDGAYTVNDDAIGLVASTLANPERAAILVPPPGCYWVHAAGFDVDPGSLFDLTVTEIAQPFITVAALPGSITPGLPAMVTVDYSLPLSQGTFGGTVFVGSSVFPMAIPIPLALTADLPPIFSNETPRDVTLSDPSPTISLNMRDWPDPFETQVDTASVEVLLDGVSLTSFATITPTSLTLPVPIVLAEGTHAVIVKAADLTGSASSSAWVFAVDTGVPPLVITSPNLTVTSDPDVLFEGTTDPTANLTVNGSAVFVSFFGKFTTTLTLPEGLHAIEVVATDAAGNTNMVTVEIRVDLTPPALTLTNPADGATVEIASVQVAGTTDPDATVTVNGLVVVVANGSFSIGQALSEGPNTITVIATDLAGNQATQSVTVTFNNPVPGLEGDLDAANANLGALQTLIFVLGGLVAAVAAVAGILFFLWWRGRKTD